jgi:hypothetical protein
LPAPKKLQTLNQHRSVLLKHPAGSLGEQLRALLDHALLLPPLLLNLMRPNPCKQRCA